ncbi:MAG TPA: MopE-related protein [Candidatus Polarisedimenticolia bacterium]|jgi:N-acetylneuraminic acid mutarotase|nr:MopE-related protein [Candidatus Polarisedimenticolia bacterium]
MRTATGLCLTILTLLPFAFTPAPARDLTFEQRVKAQKAIERIYYSHQIGATAAFEKAVPREVLEKKVRTYMKQSVALERIWKTPVTAEALRREAERIAKSTRFPERLREVYTALGNDGFLIEECFARPALVDRLSRRFFASDERLRKAPAGSQATTSWDAWWAANQAMFSASAVHAVASERKPPPEPSAGSSSPWSADPNLFTTSGPAIDLFSTGDIWDNGILDDLPTFRSAAIAVWTGSVMIVWGGGFPVVNTGGRYDPLTDTWLSTSTLNAPAPRQGHTAVWTGSVMVVWGGTGRSGGGTEMNSGGRYDPVSDSWSPTSMLNAPDARSAHTAIWTGTKMVIWGGGFNGAGSPDLLLGSGGQYDPVADSWQATATLNAPTPRQGHTAVWTGSHMVIWSGSNGSGYESTGGRYDPEADTWLPTSTVNAPEARVLHTMVWAAGRVVVWGGFNQTVDINTGGRYDPASDQWESISALGTPEAREGFTGVSTGSELIVWGGVRTNDRSFTALDSGGRYDPSTDSWVSTSLVNAPSGRSGHVAVWTGSQMIAWGGQTQGSTSSSGGRYDPATDTWTPTGETGAPPLMVTASSVWTGNVMIVMGGPPNASARGARYDPLLDSWTPVSTVGAYARGRHTAVWTGSLMVVWGGISSSPFPPAGAGARYDPISDIWSPVTNVNAPRHRYDHTAVWTGTRMIVWGGLDETTAFATGGEYDPVADVWTLFSASPAVPARLNHSAVWTGSKMLIWGGYQRNFDGSLIPLNTGGSYNPSTHTAAPLSTLGAPSPRAFHTAVWTGSRMLIWGGYDGTEFPPRDGTHVVGTGAKYDPATDGWTPMSDAGAPSPSLQVPPIWTGSEMLVWLEPSIMGGRYNPDLDAWVPVTNLNAPRVPPITLIAEISNPLIPRLDSLAAWTGCRMIVWNAFWRTGGRYGTDSAVDEDGDGFTLCDGDCDEGNTSVHPGAAELCNGIDDDCDGAIDEVDSDGDHFTCAIDCDDANPDVHPGVAELCNGVDDDCDGSVDETGAALCDQSNPCIAAACGGTSGCQYTVLPDGTSCREFPCGAGTCRAGDCAPTISVLLTPNVLSLVNHKMVAVHASVSATSSTCGPPTVVLTSIVSNEPDDVPGPSDGHTLNDIQGAAVGTADFDFELRAERDRNGSGRTYTVTYNATDSDGRSTPGSGLVVVRAPARSQASGMTPGRTKRERR